MVKLKSAELKLDLTNADEKEVNKEDEQKDNGVSKVGEKDAEDKCKLDKEERVININLGDDGDTMSGVSLASSSNVNEPIMNIIKCKRRERGKRQRNHSDGNISTEKKLPHRKSSRINTAPSAKSDRQRTLKATPPPAASNNSGSTLQSSG